jgi:hypothetical protein
MSSEMPGLFFFAGNFVSFPDAHLHMQPNLEILIEHRSDERSYPMKKSRQKSHRL